ncbi:hypothetical protein AVEN_229468-1 [Araneus ventricosus]|uniref:Uncharacterized protein n=1 Tax=Araneus ventricosus TaxID=182803 RepID=A0A4Y2L6B2_ARAVE|nr:hypothetical protein AVEN_229468-1 [Araneus ventricosus]
MKTSLLLLLFVFLAVDGQRVAIRRSEYFSLLLPTNSSPLEGLTATGGGGVILFDGRGTEGGNVVVDKEVRSRAVLVRIQPRGKPQPQFLPLGDVSGGLRYPPSFGLAIILYFGQQKSWNEEKEYSYVNVGEFIELRLNKPTT